jgi:Tfp pilus assembly protein PilF
VAALVIAILAAQSYRQTATWRNGATLFRHALRVHPGNPMAHYQLGRLLLAQGRASEAEPHLENAAQRMPRNHEAVANLGVAALALGRSRQAVAHLERALQLAPDSSETRVQLARAQMALGDLAAAEASLRAVVAREPDLASGQLWLGVVLERSGRPEEAATAYASAERAAERDVAASRGTDPQAVRLLREARARRGTSR